MQRRIHIDANQYEKMLRVGEVGYDRPNRSKKTKSSTKRPGVTDIARTTSKKVVVTARVLNVRSGPGTKYRKMTKIKYGQKFQAFERRGNWRKIKLDNGQMGWVHIKYTREIKKIEYVLVGYAHVRTLL